MTFPSQFKPNLRTPHKPPLKIKFVHKFRNKDTKQKKYLA